MNLVNKPPYMGLNCINRLLFATTLICELASQKISLKCNTLNLFQAFATLKKKLSKTNALVSQLTHFVIYSCGDNEFMGIYGNLTGSVYSGKSTHGRQSEGISSAHVVVYTTTWWIWTRHISWHCCSRNAKGRWTVTSWTSEVITFLENDQIYLK